MKLKRLAFTGLYYGAVLSTVLAGSALAMTDQADQQPQPAYQLPQAVKSVLTDIIRLPGGALVAVGERGHILRSEDGNNWQQSQVPVQANLTSVYFIDDKQGWAVGHDATILASKDGGRSWQLQQFLPALDKPLFDVFFKDSQHGFAVGAYGLFFESSDGGASWQQSWHAAFANEDDRAMLAELKDTDPAAYQDELASVLPHLNRLVVRNNTIYLVGEAGFWAISQDFGRSWQRQPEFYNGSLFTIEQTAAGTLLAAGLRGHAFRSTDQGQNWQPIALSSPATLNSLQTEGQQVWLFGNSGVVFHSADDGATFSLIPQTEGKAVLNGLPQQGQLLLVTETGVKTISSKADR